MIFLKYKEISTINDRFSFYKKNHTTVYTYVFYFLLNVILCVIRYLHH